MGSLDSLLLLCRCMRYVYVESGSPWSGAVDLMVWSEFSKHLLSSYSHLAGEQAIGKFSWTGSYTSWLAWYPQGWLGQG